MHDAIMILSLTNLYQVFANYEEQRNWIIEEILSSLVKLSASKQKAGLFRSAMGLVAIDITSDLFQTSGREVYSHRVRTPVTARADFCARHICTS